MHDELGIRAPRFKLCFELEFELVPEFERVSPLTCLPSVA